MNELLLKFFEILVVVLLTSYARSRPNSIFGRYGLKEFNFLPFPPEPNELESDYLMRRGLWIFTWVIQILIVCAVAWYLLDKVMDSNMIIAFVVRFAMPVLAGVCLIRCVIVYLKAFVCKMRKTQRVFRNPEEGFVVNELNGTH